MSQSENSRLVTISYSLSENPGIVTLDILTNGVSIGAENIRYLHGDVNREVEIGTHTITWRPDKSWPGHQVTNATARVCAWAKSSPPDYMAVSLVSDDVNWYTCTNALPEGIGSDRYRGDILLMRRICRPDAGVWVMGSPSGESGRVADWETLHRVTLTNDYWIGVFEVTQRQWEIIKGTRPAQYKGSFRPVEKVSYDMIRGKEVEFYYPNDPCPDSFIGILRMKTGLSFDLPSDMQWEYACRAGTSSAFNNGEDGGLEKLGCFSGNKGSGQHRRVGSYLPNLWGLYDMHGNVWEWCLDFFSENISGLDGQVNTASARMRVPRGGGWTDGVGLCRSGMRNGVAPSGTYSHFGFRLVCPAGL